MDLTTLVLFQVLNGLVWGLVIALIALGLALIFGIMEVINVAHGSLYMLGAVIAWYVLGATGSFAAAVLAAPIAVGVFAMAMERVVLRPIENEKVLTIIATTGVMLVLQHSVLATFGGGIQRIPSPMPGAVKILGLHYPVYRIVVAGVSLAVIALLWLFLAHTRYGLWLRSVRQDAKMATALGIPVGRVYMLAVGLGGVLAGLGGVLAAPIVVIQYQMGFDILATVFIVVVIGGFGSLFGAAATMVLAMALAIGLASANAGPLPNTPDEMLDPQKAFRISARALDAKSVEVEFKIANGYYLYRNRFSFATESGEPLADVEIPRGKIKEDRFFGKTETFRDLVRIRMTLSPRDAARGSVNLRVTSQGCADVGVCYVPLEQLVRVSLRGGGSQ